MEESLSIYQICQACLEVQENSEMIRNNTNIHHLYQLITTTMRSQQALTQDNRDVFLCQNCHHFLQKIEVFSQVCVQSYLYLTTALQNGKLDPELFHREKPKMHQKYSLSISKVICTSYGASGDEEVGDIKSEETQPSESLSRVKYEDEPANCVDFCDSPGGFSPSELLDEESKIKVEPVYDDDDLIPLKYVKVRKKRKHKKKREGEKKSSKVTRKLKVKKCEEDLESGVQITEKNIIQISKEDQLRELQERKEREEFRQATYKCQDCALTFKHTFYLENHMKRHDVTKGDMECWLCKMRFNNNSTKKNHVRNHSIRLVCHMCPYKTNVKVRLLRHLKWHAGYSYTCRICGLSFAANHLLEKHETGHRYDMTKFDEGINSLERPSFTCDICNKVCSSEGYLLNHKKVHAARSDQYYCVECDVYFKSEYSLNYHLKFSSAHKDPSLLRIKCERCTKRFESEEQLASHIQTSHEKIPRHSCEVCGARYVTKQGLNLHRRKAHEGFVLPLKYECSYCGKKFTGSSFLNSHIRTHTGERPFECSQCDWKFTQQSALRTHIKLKHLKAKRNAKKAPGELSDEMPHPTA